jgi:hypothetical protein
MGKRRVLSKDDIDTTTQETPEGWATGVPEKPKPHRLLVYFGFEHLPPQLRDASEPFSKLANMISEAMVTDEAERTVALRKLLEAKDCFVRSCIKVEKP